MAMRNVVSSLLEEPEQPASPKAVIAAIHPSAHFFKFDRSLCYLFYLVLL
jgi:hypothetical protein